MGTSISGLEYDPLSQVNTKYSGIIDATEKEQTSYMDFDTYLQLLVAKMSNQDFNDPMDDTEVLNQMSSYSMLEGIKNMTSQSNISYASSLVGKAVTIAEGDVYDTGMIQSVVISNGNPKIIVNGTEHELSTISDVVDADTYKELASLIGKSVTATSTSTSSDTDTSETDTADTTVNGTVTNVLVIGGAQFVVIDKTKIFARSSVTVNDSASSSDESTAASASYSVTDEVSETNAAASFADDKLSSVSKTYEQKAEDLYKELMSALDNVSAASNEDFTDLFKGEYVYITNIDVPDYAAAAFGEEDSFIQSISAKSSSTYKSTSIDEVKTMSSASLGTIKSSPVDDLNGISTSNSVPVRKYAEYFPDETALADSYGTRMYDIRFINNKAITSRINTSTVIGQTDSGREVTEIGFSGVGRLGEVVTFKEGKQRVEILHEDGTSSWLFTSGNYTLDTICDSNLRTAGLVPELSPQECAIRNYALRTFFPDKSRMTSLDSIVSMLQTMGVSTSYSS